MKQKKLTHAEAQRRKGETGSEWLSSAPLRLCVRIPFQRMCLVAAMAVVGCGLQPTTAVAQLDFLKSLLGGRQQPQSRFAGHGLLAQASQQAQQGDIAKSLQSVRDAFKGGGVKQPFNDPDSLAISQNLMSLSKLWAEKHAPPQDVAQILRDVVLPPSPNGEVLPYPSQWPLTYDVLLLSRPNARLPAPESVAAELVRWTMLAKQTDELRERLNAALESPKRNWLARVVGVQWAVADNEFLVANAYLEALALDAKSLVDATQLEMLCHAVMAAVRNPRTEAAGLSLLEAALDRADATLDQEAGLKGNSNWLRLHAARQHVRAGRLEDAARIAKAVAAKPYGDQRFGADYSLALRHLQIQQAAAVLLEGGLVAEALEILAPISEGPVPRVIAYYEQFNTAAMLGRELQNLSPQARFDVLRPWVLPRGERLEIRDQSDFVPESHASHKLPSSGLLGDIYSTSWQLLATAKELGKLDEVLQELAVLPQPTPQIEALRVLGAVLRDGSSTTEPQGASRGSGESTGSSGANSKGPAASASRLRETTARLQKLLDTTNQDLANLNSPSQGTFPMLTLVVASEAARHPEWRSVSQTLLQKLIEHSQKIQWDRPRAHARMTMMEVMRLSGAGNSQTTSLDDWAKLRPRHWIEAGIQTASQHASGSLPEVWCALDGYVQHLTGPYESELSFESPLSGNFELSFECREGGWAEGNSGYGGAQFQIYGYANSVSLMGKGRSGYESGPNMTNLLHKGPWNRYTIQVEDGVVRYLANGQFVFEDKLAASAPWLTIGADWGRTPIFRNFRLTGTPTIPREIPLLTNARLRGWVGSHFGESRSDPLRGPRRFVQKTVEQNGQTITTLVDADETNADEAIVSDEPRTDWQFQNGELTSSRREEFWSGAIESWLTYQRPLQDGDSLRFEFFHQPGQTDAAPTIGRVAYSFSADGVTRHWISDGPSDVFATRTDRDNAANMTRPPGEPAGVSPRTAVTAATANVRGLTPAGSPHKNSLKANEWNSVEVTLSGEQLTISLNGAAVVTEKLKPSDSRLFGFYHDAARTALRVRNAVLVGNWPTEFNDELRAAIEWPEPAELLPNMRFVGAAFTEDRISDNAYEIYRRALTLDVKSRYEFLHRWIMPNSSHDLLRMAGAFTPTHPAPPVLNEHPIDVAMAETRQAVDQRFVQTGGNFVCPAILLVLAAAETDRLDELRQEVEKHPPTSSMEMARNRAALLGIIALIQDRPEETVAALWECSQLISDKIAQPMYARWGDVAMASLAVQHPVTQDAAYELLDRIQRKQLQTGKPGTSDYGRFVRQLHGQVHYLMHGGASEEFGTQPRTEQWRMVPQASAKSRGEGYPIASFDTLTGEMAIRGGHEFDMAYFQSPLRGNYEVSGRLSNIGYRETMLMAAGIANATRYTYTESRLLHVRTQIENVPTPAPMPKVPNGFDYKIVVRDGHYTSYVNGQQLYAADLPDQPDPWLAVLGLAGHSSRYARNIVITGNPEIPSELDLLATGDLKGWMTDYYGNTVGESPFAWTTQDGVLMSNQTPIRNEVPGRLKVEDILRYHRPMLEDGVISYEFFYDPETTITVTDPNRREFVNGVVRNSQRTINGQTLVHPALDRLVCLIEPDGVKIHWLTDGRFDRTGLLPGNRGAGFQPARAGLDGQVENLPHELPLKPRDWNAVQFAVKGDTLTITLNGELVFMREIEPTNLRHFGLFHYSNESSVRVRNIRYRGDWPKTLPPVEQQELAASPEQVAVTPDAELPDTATFDFTGSKFNAADFAYHWDAARVAKLIKPTASGLRFELPTGEAKPFNAGVHPKFRLSGDFVVTIDYEGLKTSPVEKSWGSGLSFKLHLEGSYETGLEAREQNGNQGTRAMWQIVSPLKEHLYKDESLPGFSESGRMRLQRRGPTLYYFFTEPDSKEFRLLAQRPIGTNDVTQINIQADASDEAGGAEFVLKRLSIRASRITKVK